MPSGNRQALAGTVFRVGVAGRGAVYQSRSRKQRPTGMEAAEGVPSAPWAKRRLRTRAAARFRLVRVEPGFESATSRPVATRRQHFPRAYRLGAPMPTRCYLSEITGISFGAIPHSPAEDQPCPAGAAVRRRQPPSAAPCHGAPSTPRPPGQSCRATCCR